MTDIAEDPVTLLAESVVTMIEDQRRQNERVIAEMRALVEAVRSLPAPVVNVSAPDVVVPAPEVHVEAARAIVPAIQDIRIVGLPPMKARVRRDPMGQISSIEE